MIYRGFCKAVAAARSIVVEGAIFGILLCLILWDGVSREPLDSKDWEG